MEHLRDYWLVAGVLFGLMVVISGCEDDDDGDNVTDTEVRYDNIELTGEAEVPMVTTDGSGTLNATYNKETMIISYDVSWTLGNESDQTTGMHFHGPASTTESADVVIGITVDTASTGSISGETRALTQDEENDLLNGLWYLNVHSTTYPAGEIRGQLNKNVTNGGNNGGNGGNGGGAGPGY